MTWMKYGHLMLPGTFSTKITSNIAFTAEAVVQRDVPVVETGNVDINPLLCNRNKDMFILTLYFAMS